MALTRKMLKALGLSEETIETIVEAHVETVNAITRERDDFKAKAETLDDVTKERDTYKAQAEKNGDAAKVRAEFDAFKQKVEGEKTLTAKRAALLAAAEQAGVSREQFRNAIAKAWDMDKLELDENGDAKDMDGLKAAIQQDYADFIGKPGTDPVPTANPPAGNGKSKDPFEMGFDE